jgi:hypothetical protein
MDILRVKQRAATFIAGKNLAFPVKVQLLDVGMNVVLETEATEDENGVCLFSTTSPGSGTTLAAPGPFTLRFTDADGRAFLENL